MNTVAVHRANIMDALGIHKTAELGGLRDPQRPREYFLTRLSPHGNKAGSANSGGTLRANPCYEPREFDCAALGCLLARNFRAFLARFGKADRDGLFAALNRAALSAFP